MIQCSLVELDLNVVTAYFDNPSGVPVFSALDAGGLYVKKIFIYSRLHKCVKTHFCVLFVLDK
jgi:hypothetical protein